VLRYDGANGEFMDVFATDPQGSSPATDMKFGPNGNLYVAALSHGVFQFDANTGVSLGNFVPPDHFSFATGIAFGPDEDLYVATGPGNSVLRYSGATGDFIDTFIATRLNGAQGIGFGPDGKFYVAGLFNDAILRYDGQTGAFIDIFAFSGIDAPMFFVFAVPEPDGLVLVLLAVFAPGNRALATRARDA
jgi:DNA-binding beta-propeller fold protein YncE